jgi:hypothetical protein
MVDNVAITAGTGTDVATDDIAGVHYQRVKVAHGADGSATDVSTASPMPVQGAVAGGVAVAGNPVPTGGSYNSTLPTYSTGQRGELQQGTRGALHIQIQTPDSATPVAGSSFADGASNSGTGLRSWAGNNIWNGSTWDRQPGDTTNGTDVDVTRVIPGTSATHLGKAIDTAAGGTDTGVAALAIRDDTLATLTPVDGDYVGLRTTSTGALWVQDASLNSNGQVTAANSSPVVMASDRQNTVVRDVTASTDTAAYASGDLIADTQQIDAFFNKTDGCGVINSITIIDEEAQNVKFFILFHSTSTSMGSENSAANISDANASASIQGVVTVETTDWITGISGVSVACIKNIGLPVKAVSGTDDLYFSIVNHTGTPDWDADSLKLRIGALLD